MIPNKLVTALQLGGALLALPAGLAGLYTAYQINFSTEATCRSLRAAIVSTLDRNVDVPAKRALVHKDLTEFERSCALTDPEARAVFAALDRNVLFAVDPDRAASRPVRFVPPPPFMGFRPGGHPLQRMPEQRRERPFGT